jgi:hypothetical protein
VLPLEGCEACSATWNLGTNLAFALGPRKTTDNLDGIADTGSNIEYIQIQSVTSQETYYVSATKPNRLMLFRETVTVYCENHTEHINTLCGQNTELKEVVHIVTVVL